MNQCRGPHPAAGSVRRIHQSALTLRSRAVLRSLARCGRRRAGLPPPPRLRRGLAEALRAKADAPLAQGADEFFGTLPETLFHEKSARKSGRPGGEPVDAVERARVGSGGLGLGFEPKSFVKEEWAGPPSVPSLLPLGGHALLQTPGMIPEYFKNPGPARARSAGGSRCRSQMHTPRHIHWNEKEAWVPTRCLSRFPVILVSSYR